LKLILAAITILIISPYGKYEAVDTYMSQYLGEDNFLTGMAEEVQYYFPDIEFYSYDTLREVTVPPSSKVDGFRLAVDDEGTIYPIHGFPSCEFNEIVRQKHLQVCRSFVSGYGKFFLEMMTKQYYDTPVYVSTAEDMIAMNRSILSNHEYYFDYSDTTEQYSRIKEAYARVAFDSVSFDEGRKVFTTEYIVWNTRFGDLNF
jgi:hypothetical protein